MTDNFLDLGHLPFIHLDTFGDVGPFLADDAWVAEQKFDGSRCLIIITPDAVEFHGRKGKPLAHSASKVHFDALRAAVAPIQAAEGLVELVIDGELVHYHGQYHAFDLPTARFTTGEVVTPDSTLDERRRALEHIGSLITEPKIEVVYQARTTAEKQALAEAILDNNCEGLVVKERTSTYAQGKRTSSGLKAKTYKSCDVVCIARNEKSDASAAFAMYDGDELRRVGSCSMIGKPDWQPGEVGEVKYLYAGSALILYQPTLLRVRDDKDPRDCTIDQLVPTSRKAVTP